jgi:hypothetical protein
MRTTLLAGLVVVLILLSACGGSGPAGEPVTKAEDVLGVWRRTKRWSAAFPAIYMQFRADGTMGFSTVPDKWDYEWMGVDFAFEGSRLSVTETTWRAWSSDPNPQSCTDGSGAPSGDYEIQLLANGNLKFVNAQDGCEYRREILTLAEWEAVP